MDVNYYNMPLVDDLLNRICQKLQLDDTRRNRAHDHFQTVVKWLEEDEEFFKHYDFDVYSQGSYRLGTTVKPKGKDEYDLDFVMEINHKEIPPIKILDELERRLNENKKYFPEIRRWDRCIKINYAGDFHMDIIPAIPKDQFRGDNILIPDRLPKCWTESCPKGYIKWFESRYMQRKVLMEKALNVEKLPNKQPFELLQPLQRATQLIKRFRDIYFENKTGVKPASILLTTLAGTYYAQEKSENNAIQNILNGIVKDINRSGMTFKVPNPANTNENFADSWHEKPNLYQEFRNFIFDFCNTWNVLVEEKGIAKITKHLEKLFGEEISQSVITEHADYQDSLRRSGLVTIQDSGLISILNDKFSKPIKQNTFFGS